MIEFNEPHVKIHENDQYREMAGRAAVLYVRGVEDLFDNRPDLFAAAFKEVHRLHEEMSRMMIDNRDSCPDAGKMFRVMVEDMRNYGVSHILGARVAERDPYDIDFPQAILDQVRPLPAKRLDTDALRLLGDYRGWVSYCRIDHLIMEIDVEGVEEGRVTVARASDRAWQFYYCRRVLAPIGVKLQMVLDAGHADASDPIAHAYDYLNRFVERMQRDVEAGCRSLGIIDPERARNTDCPEGGPSIECAEGWMGEILIGYVDGLRGLKNRRSRVSNFVNRYEEVTSRVQEHGGGLGYGISLAEDEKRDRGLSPLIPGKVAHALVNEMHGRAVARMKVPFEDIVRKAANEPLVKERISKEPAPYLEPAHLEALGMLSAEYAAIQIESGLVSMRFFLDRNLTALSRRVRNAGGLIYALTADTDASQLVDSHPVVVTVDYVAQDMARILREVDREVEFLKSGKRRRKRLTH